MTLDKQRLKDYSDRFVKPSGIYALSHSVGPLCIEAKSTAQTYYLEPWETLGSDAWPQWLSQVDLFADSIATLINAKSSEICPQVNLASGFSSFLSAIRKLPEHKHKDTIVMHQDAFASMGFVVQGMASTYGFTLVLLDGNPNDQSKWLQALEDHQVLACLVTHVHSNTSVRSDVAELCTLCRRFNAFALVDIAQSVGIVHVDVHNWDADAVFGSCVKWLCGGPGAGFMYVKESLIPDLHPDDVGWFSHQNPFEFDIEHFAFAEDARRFWGGTPSILPYVMANASIGALSDIGFENIRSHNLNLKTKLIHALPESDERNALLASLGQIGGSLCVSANNMDRTLAALSNRGVKYDQRGAIIRLSLHIINTEDELNVIADCF